MKQKITALLFVAVITLSVTSAVGVAATQKTEAASPYRLSLSISTLQPQPRQKVVLSGVLKDSKETRQTNSLVPLYVNKIHRKTVRTDKNGRFSAIYTFPASALGHRVTFTAAYQGSSSTIVAWCKLRTKLTLRMWTFPVGTVVKPGQRYSVAGTLKDSHALPIRDKLVQLYSAHTGEPWKRWVTVKTHSGTIAKRNGDRYVSPLRSDQKDVRLYAKFQGDATHWDAKSPILRVQVQQEPPSLFI